MTAHQSAASGALDALTPHATGGGPTAHVLPMLRLVSDAALLLDRDGQILFANDRAGALLGREARTLVGCVAWDDMVAEAAEPLRRAFGESITSSAPAVALLRLGSRRPLEARFLPVEGAVILVIVDVGLRDQALAFDSIHEAVLIMDADSRIVDWNAAAEEVFGYTRAEAVGRTPEFFHHPELGGRLEREIQETLKMHGRWAGELPFRRKDGADGVAEVVVVEHRDERGMLLGYVGVNRDATERVRAQTALRATEERLREAQKMEAVGRLAGGVAHDFNNILTVITSYAELLRASFPDADTRVADVDEVLKATARAAGLTRQLMTFGRRQRIEPAVLDLGARLAELAPALRQLAGEQVVLELRADEGCHVRFDPRQLEQTVSNLISNARDAMAKGGVARLEVRQARVGLHDGMPASCDPAGEVDVVGAVEAGDYVVLRVVDRGAGMTPTVRRRIFEPFFSTKGLGHGTGLGLSTVYAATTQAGGHLRVCSSPGVGTTIEVYLPRVAAEGVTLAAAGDAAAPPRVGELVLVAEDETAVRLSVRRMLERAGYRVIDARHGAEALRLWRERRDEIALVLSDVIMPELNGIELANALRAEQPGVRVLFMSGYTGVGEDGETLAVNAPLLPKPFESAELLRVVREQLAGGGA